MAETVRELITKLGFKIDNLAEAKKYEDTFSRLKGAAMKFVGVIGTFEIGKHILKSAADMEDVRINFEAFTGSAEKANVLLEKISKFSIATGMNKAALQESAKQMLSMGIATEQIMPNLEMIGNLAAGVGKDKIPILTEALTKMNQKGMVDGRAFNALLTAGVPIMEQLRLQTGMNTRQIMEMGNMGALKFKDMEKALQSLTTGNGKFSNLAMKHGQSLNDIWERGKNMLNEMAERIGLRVVPSLESLGRAILNFLGGGMDKASDNIGNFLDKIMFGLGVLFEFITHSKFAKSFGEAMKQLFGSLFNMGKNFLDFLDKIHAFDTLLVVIQALAIAFDAIASDLKFINDLMKGKDILSSTEETGTKFAKTINPNITDKQIKERQKEFENSPWGKAFLPHKKEMDNNQISKIVTPGSVSDMGKKGNTFNIHSDVKLQLPHGTPLAQQQALTDLTKKIIKEQWMQNLRDINLNMPRVDFSGVKP